MIYRWLNPIGFFLHSFTPPRIPSTAVSVDNIKDLAVDFYGVFVCFGKQSEEDVSQFDAKFTRQTPVDSPDDSTLSESANQVFLVSEPKASRIPASAGFTVWAEGTSQWGKRLTLLQQCQAAVLSPCLTPAFAMTW